MIAVTVTFEVSPEHVDAFRVAVLQHAKNSLTKEPGCRRFDVSAEAGTPNRFFLYEMYENGEAFVLHQETDYFAAFGRTITPWVVTKELNEWEVISTTPAESQ